MYYKEDREQLGIEEFFLPFGGKPLGEAGKDHAVESDRGYLHEKHEPGEGTRRLQRPHGLRCDLYQGA